jgi:hypothetical protein
MQYLLFTARGGLIDFNQPGNDEIERIGNVSFSQEVVALVVADLLEKRHQGFELRGVDAAKVTHGLEQLSLNSHMFTLIIT